VQDITGPANKPAGRVFQPLNLNPFFPEQPGKTDSKKGEEKMKGYLKEYFAEIICSAGGTLLLSLITRIICKSGFSG